MAAAAVERVHAHTRPQETQNKELKEQWASECALPRNGCQVNLTVTLTTHKRECARRLVWV